jgi:ATP-dependent Clp protease ATP-binding subunit ClpC
MYEEYTEIARRALLFARYEASQFGSETTEIEHIMLAIIRADLPLAIRLFKTEEKVKAISAGIGSEIPRKQPPLSLTSELPFSSACKLVISYADIECVRLNHRLIAPEHLLIGILREKNSISARLLQENGITVEQLEQEARQARSRVSFDARELAGLRDLVSEARAGKFAPLIGRKAELDQLIQILCRRTRNSVVLIGDPGVGKDSLVRGLALRIADGDVPPDLAGRPILQADTSSLPHKFQDAAETSILYIRGLFDLRDRAAALTPYLKHGKLQVIATGAPLSLRLALDRQDELARNFEVVRVSPPGEEQTLEILTAMKEEFEKYHGVVISSEAIQTALSASGHFLRHRPLPERAIDLLDDAATKVKLQSEVLPPEVAGIRTKIRALARERDQAAVKIDLDLAQKISLQERQERDKFDRLRKEFLAARQTRTVTDDDILDVVAARMSLTVDAVRATLNRAPEPAEQTLLLGELAARIPPGRRDWVEGLLAYLTACSNQDAGHLIEAIKTVKAKLDL